MQDFYISQARKSSLRLVVFILIGFLSSELIWSQQFTDVSGAQGIIHSLNSSDGWGGGISFFDFDNDGDDDLTLILENDSIMLFRNTGGFFEKLPSIAKVIGRTRQAIWVDYDNDGDNDLFITTDGGGSCILLKNIGDFQFIDATDEAGLSGLTTRNYGATFGDFDRDGYLDLYICRYNMTGSPSNPQDVNALFRNNGNGTFTNVAFELSVQNGLQPSFMGVWVDVNNDLWPDLFVINDRDNWVNSLYLNNGDGSFTDVTEEWNAALPNDDPMTATFADFDNDGDLDIYVTNTGHPVFPPGPTPARLLVNQNSQSFNEEGTYRGVGLTAWAWGASFIDVDNDSNLDLFVATGWTNGFGSSTGEVPSAMFLNNGDHYFSEAPNGFFNTDLVAASYGVAIGDIQNDGYADIAVINAKGYNSFLLENAGGNNNYLKVTLQGVVSNRMAVGSWIEIYFGGEKRVHYTRCGENYCGQSSQHHIFGLGQSEAIDSIRVMYPSGHIDVFYDLIPNQHLTFIEGASLSKGVSADDSILCPDSTTELIALVNEPLVWNTGSTESTIVVDQAGDYFYTYISTFGIPVTSDTVSIVFEVYPEYSIENQNPSCYGADDGQIQLLINEEFADYEFIVNGLQSSWSIEELEPGAYNIQLVSPNGCVFNSDIELVDPVNFEVVPSYSSISCPGDSTELTIFAFGAQQPIEINWGENETGLLPAGDHSILVTDANGCEVGFQVTLAEPLPIEIYVSTEWSGVFNIQIEGGTPPYSLNILDPNGEHHDANAMPIAQGYYQFHVIDSNSCEATLEYFHLVSIVSSLSKRKPQVFPNPVSETLSVMTSDHYLIQLHLVDASGRLLKSKVLSGMQSIDLSMSDVAPGLYLLQLTTADGENFTYRVIRR